MAIPPASLRLPRLANALRRVGDGAHGPTIERIEQADDALGNAMHEFMERIVPAMSKVLAEAVLELGRPEHVPDEGTVETVTDLVSRHLFDPRSFRELATGVDDLAVEVAQYPRIDRRLGLVLHELEERGVLGARLMFEVARMFNALQRRPGLKILPAKTPGHFEIGDAVLSLDRLQGAAGSAKHHSKLWVPHAAARAIHGNTEVFGGVRFSDSPGAKSMFVVSERTLTELPGATSASEPMWMDPIPPALTSPDPRQELDDRKLLSLEGEGEILDNALQVIYAALAAVSDVLNTEWWARCFRVGFEFDGEERNTSFYEPARQIIVISEGPVSPWSIFHELGHAIDHEVSPDDRIFASCIEGHPFDAFTDIVRPAYRPVALAQVDEMWKRVLTHVFKDSEEKLRTSEGMELIDLLSDLKKKSLYDPLQKEDEAITAYARSHGLSMIDGAILWALRRKKRVTLTQLEFEWKAKMMEYLLHSTEIFARFFDQYMRAYLRQTGRPFGPPVRPGDLSVEVLVRHATPFLDALRQTQSGHLYLLDADPGGFVDLVPSLLISAGMIAIGAELLD